MSKRMKAPPCCDADRWVRIVVVNATRNAKTVKLREPNRRLRTIGAISSGGRLVNMMLAARRRLPARYTLVVGAASLRFEVPDGCGHIDRHFRIEPGGRKITCLCDACPFGEGATTPETPK